MFLLVNIPGLTYVARFALCFHQSDRRHSFLSPTHLAAQAMHATSTALGLIGLLLSNVPVVLARVGTEGCTFTDRPIGGYGVTRIYYVPDSQEICSLYIDCGGGRAPPKTTKPGCPGYTGTLPVEVHYLTPYMSVIGVLPKETAPAAKKESTAPLSTAPSAAASTSSTGASSQVASTPAPSSSGAVDSTTDVAGAVTTPAPTQSTGPGTASSSSSASASVVSTAGAGRVGAGLAAVGALVGAVAGFAAV